MQCASFTVLISALTEQKQQWVKLLVSSHESKQWHQTVLVSFVFFHQHRQEKEIIKFHLQTSLTKQKNTTTLLNINPWVHERTFVWFFFFELQAELLAFFTEHIFIRRKNWQTMVIQTGLFVRQAFSQNEWSNYFKKKVLPMMMKI